MSIRCRRGVLKGVHDTWKKDLPIRSWSKGKLRVMKSRISGMTDGGTTQSAAHPSRCCDDETPPTALLTAGERKPLVIVIGHLAKSLIGCKIRWHPQQMFIICCVFGLFGSGCRVRVISANVKLLVILNIISQFAYIIIKSEYRCSQQECLSDIQ